MTKLFKKKECLNENCKGVGCGLNSILFNHFQKQFERLVKGMEATKIKVIDVYIVKGKQEDISFLSFPTANSEINDKSIKNIDSGFFLSNTIIDDNIYNSVSFVNKRKNIIKTYIFDFYKNIYGDMVKIKFIKTLITIQKDDLDKKGKIKDLFIMSIEKAEKIISNRKKLF